MEHTDWTETEVGGVACGTTSFKFDCILTNDWENTKKDIIEYYNIHLLQVIGKSVEGLDVKSRLKRFIRRFVAVSAKWIKSGRQEVLNLYTRQQIYLLL